MHIKLSDKEADQFACPEYHVVSSMFYQDAQSCRLMFTMFYLYQGRCHLFRGFV